jgi:hypothetical protein
MLGLPHCFAYSQVFDSIRTLQHKDLTMVGYRISNSFRDKDSSKTTNNPAAYMPVELIVLATGCRHIFEYD